MKFFRDQRGITLLEVVIATAIISVLLTPLTGMLISAKQQQQYGEQAVKAAALAQGIMETIMAGHPVEWEGKLKPADGWYYRQEIKNVKFDARSNKFVPAEKGEWQEITVTVTYPAVNSSKAVTLKMLKER